MRPEDPVNHHPRAAQGGFTLVELLVVVGIIVVLVALLLPALRGGMRAAQRTREGAALRQVLIGWNAYAVDNKGLLLPGFKHGLPVRLADSNGIPAGAAGSVSELHARYPWRLIPYLDHEFESLYVNQQRDTLQRMRTENPQQFYYTASLYPSFGLNSTWVGGDERRYGFQPSTLPNGNVSPLHGFYVTRLSGIRHPERLTVFASARTNATTNAQIQEGYFFIEGPRFVHQQPSPWSTAYQQDVPSSYGNLSTRGGTEVLMGTADGGTEWVPVDQMRDMRHWADQATSPDWAIGQP